jgi:hypothetical protein
MSKKSYKIKLVMDRERAIHLMRACEVMARIGTGQFKSMVDLLGPNKTWDEALEIESYLKAKLMPELSSNSFRSAHSNEIKEECQVAWDAYQNIRREISWTDLGKDWRKDKREFLPIHYHDGSKSLGMMGVNFDEPMKTSKLKGNFETELVNPAGKTRRPSKP